ncbi:RmlC-like cupin domain-containing protein [Gamsiella multidivaricata]|uniref:RmlC-like cupin domain-containing protein n=1 Tax=Gamsiella multidivaricata TaxID=101098 RepID=UPI00222113E7|nr:RmlC-like cupin domain-containing protein [Gamsiella multidivaricata]KAG0350264.1 hypothetical protein BGZ54_003936 [Gamsiella multidivaricata]KAI7829539.1 RmlC-like cupin domain-containing protein [Gamsiella multidivaricata]
MSDSSATDDHSASSPDGHPCHRDHPHKVDQTQDPPPLAVTLNLAPHPEGGWFRETWTASQKLHPKGYSGTRATASAIYFVLAPNEKSKWHIVRSDELWLWHRGDPLELLLGGSNEQPDINPSIIRLGPSLEDGEVPQAIVPGGVWQAAQSVGGETLVSCVVTPAFAQEDFHVLDH